MHAFMSCEPPIALRLVGGQIVEDDGKVAVGIRRHDAVHEVEELDAPAPPIVAADYLSGGDLQGGETPSSFRAACRRVTGLSWRARSAASDNLGHAPAPGSKASRPLTAPRHCPAASCRGRRCRRPC